MKSLWTEVDRRDLLARIDKLKPNMKPLWGRMSAAQTMAHLVAWGQMVTGELKVASKNTPFRFPVIKQLVLYVAPFPKNVPTAPELQKTETGDWNDDVRELKGLVRTAVAMQKDKNTKWPDHPAFGSMSARDWGVLGFRHTDHHLRQFGL